jgi:hypothetical protein
MSFRIILVALLTIILSGILPAASSILGVATTNGNFWLDHSQVAGNATVFDGSVIETGKDMSDVLLAGGLKVRLGAESRGQVFAGRLRLQQGAGQVSGSKYLVEARGLRVLPVSSGAMVRVALGPKNLVEVAAVTGSFHVETAAGIRVANMSAGAALSFTEQAGAAPPTVLCGEVGRVDGRLLLTDKVSGVTVELVGEHLDPFVGKSISVTGNRSGNDALHVLMVKRDACGAPVVGVGAGDGTGNGSGAGGSSSGAAGAGGAAGLPTIAIAGIAVAGATGLSLGLAAAKGAFSGGNASK